MKPFLLQMAGMPGAGKSTLARAVAAETRAVLLDKDVVHTAALRTEPFSHPHLTVETTMPLDAILAEALEYIRR